MSKRQSMIWSAEPHTIAKIEILKAYLHAYFRILGKSKRGQTILYVDGFAGPGFYENHTEGSPLAALRAAQGAIFELQSAFIADHFHAAFIESDPERFELLSTTIARFDGNPSLRISKVCAAFSDGIEKIRGEVPGPFNGEGPLFVFADPFGGTGIPFATFASCMQSESAELLINLDADGIGRIFAANNNNREEQLTGLFGSECWRNELTGANGSKQLCVQILDLYKRRLRTLPEVKYIWSFAMRGKKDALNYHLVFASKHPLGLEKMKEAMRSIDKSGFYSFSDAHAEQHTLFHADDEITYAESLYIHFKEKTVTWEEARIFALNETPFLNPISMLIVLHKQKRVEAEPYEGASIKSGSFPEEKVRLLRFGQFGPTDPQESFSF